MLLQPYHKPAYVYAVKRRLIKLKCLLPLHDYSFNRIANGIVPCLLIYTASLIVTWTECYIIYTIYDAACKTSWSAPWMKISIPMNIYPNSLD